MHFPLFLELDGRDCLVVGGGKVAWRKSRVLSDFGARVKMVAPEMSGRLFEDSDVEGMVLVVAATDDAMLNARVSELCRAKGILVNVVDDPANSTFIFPAILRKGAITAAVSSGGKCPVAAKMVRDRIDGIVSDEFVDAVDRLGCDRENLKRMYSDLSERAKFYEEELLKCKG